MAWSKNHGTIAKINAEYAKAQGDHAKTEANKVERFIEDNKTNWLPAVATVALRNSTYPNPQHGDTVRVTSEAKTYRYVSPNGWVVTDIYDATAIDQVAQQLAQMGKKTDGFVNVMEFGAKGDGVTDDTVAIQKAIDSVGKGIVFFPPRTFIGQGIVPKNNITLQGYGAKLSLPTSPTKPIIAYNSNVQLLNFNMYGLTFADENQIKTVDLVNINQPNWGAPAKTWYMSVIKDCTFYGGVRGLYCPVPGSVKIDSCHFDKCDIGLKWEQEHFYIDHSVFWDCRIGLETLNGNHFTCINGVFAHCEQYGVKGGMWESAFIGCSFIDNKLGGLVGSGSRLRIEGCRILQCAVGIEVFNHNIIIGNQIGTGNLARDLSDPTTAIAVRANGNNNNISNNYITDFYDGINIKSSFNVVSDNKITQLKNNGVIYSAAENVISGNGIDVANIGILAMLLSGTSSFNNSVYDNTILRCKKDAIKIESIQTGGIISNNTIVDNGIEMANTYNGITIGNTLVAFLVTNNMIRNTGTGQMKNAVAFSTASGVADVLLANNIARNMKGTSAYVVPASIVQSANIGTVATL